MTLIVQPRRPARSGEWTEDKAVTFIVTLAASRSVTLAAKRAAMSRKSAYALRERDPRFAAAWNEALFTVVRQQRRPTLKPVEGDKVYEVYDAPVKRRQGHNPSPPWVDPFDAAMRDIFLATLANRRGNEPSGPLAREESLA